MFQIRVINMVCYRDRLISQNNCARTSSLGMSSPSLKRNVYGGLSFLSPYFINYLRYLFCDHGFWSFFIYKHSSAVTHHDLGWTFRDSTTGTRPNSSAASRSLLSRRFYRIFHRKKLPSPLICGIKVHRPDNKLGFIF